MLRLYKKISIRFLIVWLNSLLMVRLLCMFDLFPFYLFLFCFQIVQNYATNIYIYAVQIIPDLPQEQIIKFNLNSKYILTSHFVVHAVFSRSHLMSFGTSFAEPINYCVNIRNYSKPNTSKDFIDDFIDAQHAFDVLIEAHANPEPQPAPQTPPYSDCRKSLRRLASLHGYGKPSMTCSDRVSTHMQRSQ